MEGVQESLRSVDALERRVKALEGATRQQNAAVKQAASSQVVLNRSTTALATNVGQLGTKLGSMRGALMMALPGLGSMAGALGGVGSAITGVTAGFGPLGLVIAAASVPVIKLVSLMQEADRELRNVARSSVSAARSLEQVLTALQATTAARAAGERVRLGGGTAIEQQALVGQTEEERDRAAARLAMATSRRGELGAGGAAIDPRERDRLDAEIVRARADIASAERRRAEAIALRANVEEDELEQAEAWLAATHARQNAEEAAARGGGRRGGGGGRGGRGGEERQQLGLTGSDVDKDMEAAFGEQARLREEQERLQAAFEFEAAKQMERSMEQHRLRMDQISEEEDARVAMAEKAAAAEAETVGDWSAGLQEVTSIFDGVYSAAVNGEMSLSDAVQSTFKGWFQQSARKNAFLAAENIAMGIGALAWRPDAAAGHFTAAAKHGALAVGFGVGGAVMSGGGGGAPRQQQQASGGDRVLGSGVRDGRRGGDTYVINVGTFAVGTKAEVGREVRAALREADRHDGARA